MPDLDLLALNQALEGLGRDDPQRRRIVELKFFLGLSYHEIAEVLGFSSDTVKLKWAATKARLYRELKGK